ncbi:hypothetical protein B0H15DRAFT_958714 [Mycena belliarum]|uniref:Uncharacterized protein n=1 Tax=Mycena belliarum TaxID=1033014 RepID=A0AAD6XHB0_9AGAR|nr:hypothetical protein B0H15DRAFT_958714 [Mycena belliae]
MNQVVGFKAATSSLSLRQPILWCTVSAKDGVIAYIVQVLRPFAELIHVCIPSNALSVDQLPFGTCEQLRRFVVEFITQAGIVYDIAVEHAKAFRLSLQHIDSRAVWSLSLALNFDARFGNISAGYHPHTREHSISRVRSALTLANNSSGADLDVDLSMLLNSLPRVPAWNRGDIELLMQREKVDEWAGELELLNDNIIAADNLGNALAKSAQRRADGVMSLGELAVLWVKRARHLGQSLLRVVLVSYAVDLPANCVALLRTGIRVLMLNMIILAKAGVMYGPYGPTSVPRFFVPAESTTLFGMAEGMVDRFGYEGDEEEGPRQRMFQNMETLYGSMLLNRHYSRFGYDFPGFPVADADLAKFGIHPLIKNAQLSRLLLDRNGKKHNFGDELLRYNPELGEEGRWVVALPSEELEKTRPNTPEDGDLSRISEGDEGEEQVDNAFCLVSTVSDMTSPSSLSGASLASWSIFVVACRLRDISLTPEELQSYPCQPRETWPEFFENRLRPMIYFVHRAVTKDFTLVGRCGRYDDGELEEICYWVEVILLHCVSGRRAVAVFPLQWF